jgi:hypothetical protein
MSNLALPGLGSLMAGRISGYPQLLLALAGMVFTVTSGTRFVFWYIANWSRLQNPDADPFTTLGELWNELRWPVAGMGIFGAALLWALITSLTILREARAREQASDQRS